MLLSTEAPNGTHFYHHRSILLIFELYINRPNIVSWDLFVLVYISNLRVFIDE
jgi:hypothetical protein